MSSTKDLIDQQMEEWFRSALADQTPREMTMRDVPGMERPMSSGPNDIPVGRDELGRTIYETPTGQRYSVGVNPDQRTANRRFKEDMLPAIRGWVKDPKLPSIEQVGQFAGAMAREMADSLGRTVRSEGTMGEALNWAAAGLTNAPRAVSAGVRAATPNRFTEEQLRNALLSRYENAQRREQIQNFDYEDLLNQARTTAAQDNLNDYQSPVTELFEPEELDSMTREFYDEMLRFNQERGLQNEPEEGFENLDFEPDDDLEDLTADDFEGIDDLEGLEITGEGIRPPEYEDLIRRPEGASIPVSPSYGLDVDSTDFITPRGETTLVQPGQAFVYNPLFAIVEDMQISPKGIKGATLMKMLEKHPVYRRGLLEGTGIRFNPEQRYSQQEILDLLHQNTNPLFIRERSPEYFSYQRQGIGREIDYNEITLEAFPDMQDNIPQVKENHWFSDGTEPLAHSRYTVSEVDGKPIIVIDELQADSLRTGNMASSTVAEEMIKKYNIPDDIVEGLRDLGRRYQSGEVERWRIFSDPSYKDFQSWVLNPHTETRGFERGTFIDQIVRGIKPSKANPLMGDADYVRPLLGYTIMDAYERGIDEIFIPDSVAIGAKRGITDHDSLQRFRALYDKAVPKVLKQLSRELDIEFEPYTINSSNSRSVRSLFNYLQDIVRIDGGTDERFVDYFTKGPGNGHDWSQPITENMADDLEEILGMPKEKFAYEPGVSGYRVRITGEIPQGDIRFNKGGLVTKEKLYAT